MSTDNHPNLTLDQALTLLVDAQDKLEQARFDLDDCRAENEQLRDACHHLNRELARLREQRDQLRTKDQP